MTWDKVKHKVFRCACGQRVTPAGRARHELGVWHLHHEHILEMLAMGLSHAEIGRQLRVSRVHVGQMLFNAKSRGKR